MTNLSTLQKSITLLLVLIQIGLFSNLKAQNLVNNPGFEPNSNGWTVILQNGANGTKTDISGAGANGSPNFVEGENIMQGPMDFFSDVQIRNSGDDAGSPAFPGTAGFYKLSVWAKAAIPADVGKKFRLRATTKTPPNTVFQFVSTDTFTFHTNWTLHEENIWLDACAGCFADFNIMFGRFLGRFHFDDATFEYIPDFILACSENSPTSSMGANDGVGEVTITGGTADFTIDWSGPSSGSQIGSQGSNLINGLSAGTYNVTVTDAVGYNHICTFTITEPTCNLTVSGIGINPNCPNATDGSIDLSPNNGAPPYNYNWNNGSIGNGSGTNIPNLGAGNYQITITDNQNCTATTSVNLTDPPAMNLTCSENSGTSTVGGSDGVGEIDISGGSPNFTINWSGTGIGSQSGSSGSNLINGLSAGTYNVTVTDNNNCMETCSFTITDPTCALSVSGIGTNPTCPNATDGSIDLSPNQGTPPYNYNWNNGSTGSGSGTNIPSLGAGNYQITITDNQNCTATTSVNLIDPPAMNLTCSENSGTSTIGGNDGIGAIDISGGTPNFTINWSGAGTGSQPANSGNNLINGLSAGTYNVTVTDNNNCEETCSFTINDPNCNLTVSDIGTNPTCPNATDGSIDLSPTNGNPPYNYNWNNGSTGNGSGTNIPNLGAGNYQITITDNQNCTATTSVNLVDPPAMNLTCSENSGTSTVGGNDGIGAVNILGGMPNFTINWSGAGTGSQPGNSGSNLINGLSAGTYNVTVSDNNNCEETCSFTITDPTCALSVSGTGTNPTCPNATDGSIDLSPNQGTPSYSYNWNNGSTGSGSGTNIPNLGAGNYQITITDNQNCTATTSVNLIDPPAMNLTCSENSGTSAIGGNDGIGTVNISGGTANFTINWSGAGTGSQPANSGNNLINGLSAGTYNVTVTDNNNCEETCSFTITDPTCTLSVSGIGTNPTCPNATNGSIDLSPNNGTPPYNYNWNNGSTGNGSGTNISNLGAGNYQITITDNQNCTATTSLQLTDPPSIILSCSEQSSVTTMGGTDGIGNVNISGGTAGFNISWSGQSSGSQAGNLGNNFINNLTAGNYSVTVTDTNNCQEICSFIITEPTCNLTVSGIGTDPLCNGENSGTINLIPQNGNPNYTFEWNNGINSDSGNGTTISNLFAGNYQITLTDANNCTATTSIQLTDPTPIILNCSEQSGVSTIGGTDGIGNVNISGGTAPFSISWNGANSGSQVGNLGDNFINNLSSGNYSVTVMDANNCQQTCSFIITEPNCNLSVSATGMNPLCNGENTGLITLIILNGTPNYSYQWNNGTNSDTGTGITIPNLFAGNYNITITDGNNCSTATSIQLTDPPPMILNCSEQSGVSTIGGTDGTGNVNISGGTAPFSINWNGANSGSQVGNLGDNFINNLSSGNFNVTVTDANNCIENCTFFISEPGCDLSATISIASQLCEIGTLILEPTNGQVPYNFMWDNGLTTNSGAGLTINNLAAGNYSITLTDANSCNTILNPTIFENPELTQVFIQNTTCGISDNGSLTILATGNGNLEYSLDGTNWQANNLFENLTADSYTVFVRNENLCSITQNVIIETDPEPTIDDIQIINENCGMSDGELTILATGNNLEYSMNGIDFQISNTFSSLSANVYTISVRDENNCISTQMATIQNLGGPTISDIQIIDENCGMSDGELTIFVTGSNLEYSINGVDFQTANTFSSLSANTYTVSVRDENNCISTQMATIQNLSGSTISDIQIIDENCGMSDGELTILATGNNLEYSINGVDFQGSNNFSGLSANVYTISVRDENNCISTQMVTLQNLSTLEILDIFTMSETCEMQNGSLEISANGGTGNLEYSLNGIDFQSANIFENLAANNYTIMVQDELGCTVSQTTEIGSINGPILTIDDSTNPNCGSTNGEIIASATGGTGNLEFSINSIDFQTLGIFSGLSANTYNVTVQDENDCINSQEISLNDEGGPMITNIEITNETCEMSNGSLEISAIGGTGDLEYSINGIDFQTANIFENLTANNYVVTVQDATGCAASEAADLQNLPSPETVFGNDISQCFGDGSIILNAENEGATYLWTVTPNDGNDGATSQTITINDAVLATTIYSVEITQNGCSITDEIEITIFDLPEIELGDDQIQCQGEGEISLDAGNENANFLWTVNPDEGNNGATSQTILIQDEILEMTNFSVAITENGCSNSDEINITINENPTAENAQLSNCDSGNGTAVFDLNTANDLILNGQTGIISYHENSVDASEGENDLALNFEANDGQIIFARVENAAGCFAISELIFEIKPLPNFDELDKNCAANLLTYSINFNSNGNPVEPSNANLINNGNGNFMLQNIPSGEDILLQIFDAEMDCQIEIPIQGLVCDCEEIPAPTGDDMTICEGEDLPNLVATAEAGLQINWYDAPVNGNLILENSNILMPNSAGIFYVEAIDPNSNCNSERIAIELIINELPVFTEIEKVCANNLLTYFVIIETNANSINSLEGNIMDNGNGTFTISEIPANSNLNIDLQNTLTNCSQIIEIESPNCDCPIFETPIVNTFCEDNGTPNDPTDDLFSYNIFVEISMGTTFSISGDDTQTNLNYNQISNQFGTFTIANGALNLVISDDDTEGTCFTEIAIIPPPTCSNCTETAEAGEDQILTCEITEVTLNASATSSGIFNWQTPSGGIPDNQNPLVDEAGIYTLTVTFDNGCTDSDIVEVIFNNIPPSVNAGDDQILDCNIFMATLDGSLSEMGDNISYEWQNEMGEVLGTDLILEVEETGVFQLFANNSENGCSNSDEVQVFDFQLIIANDDNFELNADETLNEDILQNDNLGNYQNLMIDILNPAQNGEAILDNEGNLDYQVNSNFGGTESITYQICAEECPEVCDQAEINIEILIEEIFVPEGITPNGDGMNDIWIIAGIEQFPESRVTITNRWGDVVYEAEPYLNDWEGTNKKGQPLPDGTYYYWVRLEVLEGIRTGTVTIIR